MNHGLSLGMDVVDTILSRSTGKRREVMDGYHQKLAEILGATRPEQVIPRRL